jgi:ribosomal RNA assembly protein
MSSEGLRLRIPGERVGVLIGPEGGIKSAIENKLSVEMSVDGDTGNVEIVSSAGGNPADMFKARDVVTAIGRGFSPENAFKLFDEDAVLIIIDLREYFGRSDSDIGRVKSRIIGEKGKARRNLEEISGTKISLYGHTIAIIGDVVHTGIAREAVEMFIEGRSHSTVYRSLQIKRDELRKQEAEIWRGPEGKE